MDYSHKNIEFLPMDVTNIDQIKDVISQIKEKHDSLDVLVNNAGVWIMSPFEKVTLGEMKHLFDVNFFGSVLVMQEALPIMRKQNRGHIINVTSASGFDPAIGLDTYAASKSALEALSECMASYLNQFNIKVSLVEPGPVKTNFINTMQLGSREVENDPYVTLMNNLSKRYIHSLQNSQDPKEVALLVLDIINEVNPNFRYQTSPTVVQRATKRLVDITGNSAVKEKSEAITAFFN